MIQIWSVVKAYFDKHWRNLSSCCIQLIRSVFRSIYTDDDKVSTIQMERNLGEGISSTKKCSLEWRLLIGLHCNLIKNSRLRRKGRFYVAACLDWKGFIRSLWITQPSRRYQQSKMSSKRHLAKFIFSLVTTQTVSYGTKKTSINRKHMWNQ